MEIERKYLVNEELMPNLSNAEYTHIEQAYLCRKPVVRVRREDEEYTLTYKGSGMLAREEYNHELDQNAYEHLKAKADGNVITKCRYRIPYENHIIELDIFEGHKSGLIMAEVEFVSEKESEEFTAPNWFTKEVTYDSKYHNSTM